MQSFASKSGNLIPTITAKIRNSISMGKKSSNTLQYRLPIKSLKGKTYSQSKTQDNQK